MMMYRLFMGLLAHGFAGTHLKLEGGWQLTARELYIEYPHRKVFIRDKPFSAGDPPRIFAC